MKRTVFFVTGTDTGVGKTVLTALLARQIRRAGVGVAAVKPLASGGRADARALRRALAGTLALDDLNPWHFRLPLTPLLAARHERRAVRRSAVLRWLRSIEACHDVVLIEGAGGLLSPLGEDFDARDLIAATRAVPLVVCPNRLGAINQALLVLAALPPRAARQAQLVLMAPRRANHVSRSNFTMLAAQVGIGRVHQLPWLSPAQRALRAPLPAAAKRTLAALAAACG